MRDDLHKGTSLPRPWKKAVGTCLRPADQGPRSRRAVSEALEGDLRRNVTKRGLDLIRQECEAPSLPFGGQPGARFESGATDNLTATERRLRDLAKSRIARGECATGDDAIRSSLIDLSNEQLRARQYQAESQLLRNDPAESSAAVAALRKNFHADTTDVVDRILEADRGRRRDKSNGKLDPDDDLRS